MVCISSFSLLEHVVRTRSMVPVNINNTSFPLIYLHHSDISDLLLFYKVSIYNVEGRVVTNLSRLNKDIRFIR